MTNDRPLTIQALGAMIAGRKLTASSVDEVVQRRIGTVNPEIKALTSILKTSTLQEVDRIERTFAAGAPLGTLAGISIAIKDNIDTTPAICSAGLDFLNHYRPQQDAEVVRLLRAAGAVIIGVAATDSGAFGVTTPAVVNPTTPERIAGGSSGGSAAAVAAGLCMAAIGTDTGGSIRIPAACCGIVGFKPTRGRVSTQGVRPLAASIDHVGPLARVVCDVCAIMEVIDPGFSDLPSLAETDRPTIGIPRAFFADAAPEVLLAVEEAIKRCIDLGSTVVEVGFPKPDDIIPSHLVLSLSEAAFFHADTSGVSLDLYPDTAKEALLLGQSYSSVQYLRAIHRQRAFVDEIKQTFAPVDFLMLPTLPVETPHRHSTAFRLGATDIPLLEALIRYTAVFDQTGHPALALPWHSSRLAVAGSVQLVGAPNSDRRLLAFAERLECRDGISASLPLPFAVVHK